MLLRLTLSPTPLPEGEGLQASGACYQQDAGEGALAYLQQAFGKVSNYLDTWL